MVTTHLSIFISIFICLSLSINICLQSKHAACLTFSNLSRAYSKVIEYQLKSAHTLYTFCTLNDLIDIVYICICMESVQLVVSCNSKILSTVLKQQNLENVSVKRSLACSLSLYLYFALSLFLSPTISLALTRIARR